jgi:hypothetical protein
MTVTINASTSSGVVITPDYSGNIQLQYNGVAAPAFSAYNSSTQTLSSATYTKIQFQTEEFDTANCFDNSTNYRFTPNVAGYYQIGGGISSASSATGIIVNLYKNGSSHRLLYFNGFGDFSRSNGGFGSALVYMNGSTDYVELYGYFTTGQSVTTGVNSSYFQACLLRGA